MSLVYFCFEINARSVDGRDSILYADDAKLFRFAAFIDVYVKFILFLTHEI